MDKIKIIKNCSTALCALNDLKNFYVGDTEREQAIKQVECLLQLEIKVAAAELGK